MASLQFEGLLDGLSEKQVQFIRNVLEKRGFKHNKVIIAPVGKPGENFLAQVLRITVKVESGDDFTMIGKISPQNEYVRSVQNTKLLFRNETTIYEDILPKYSKLQIEAGVPESERFRYAQCYGCKTEEPYEVVLIEDLKPLDYVMLDRLTPMNEDAVLLTLKNFANLHAMSFVLMHMEPETYKKYSSRLTKLWDIMSKSKEQKAFSHLVKTSALEILKEERYKEPLRGNTEQHLLFERNSKEDNPKYLVIQQGDAWTNNMMFKLKDGKPLDAILIDYQLASQTSPAADLIYYIFNCTNYEARAKNYHRWIDTYHEHLDTYLSYFNLKASDVYPKEVLNADLKRYANLYFGLIVMLYGFMSRNPEEAAAMHEALKMQSDTFDPLNVGIESLSEDTVTKFKCRLEELIDSYRDLGYIS